LTGLQNPVIIHTSQQGADMKRVEVEELLQQMEQFADFLFAQGKAGAGNAVLDAVSSVDAALEDHVLED
jgi:hypothetical protein